MKTTIATLAVLAGLYSAPAMGHEMNVMPVERPSVPVQEWPEQHYAAVLTEDFMEWLKPVYLGRAPLKKD